MLLWRGNVWAKKWTKRWLSHQKVLSCKRWEPQIQGFWCEDESGVSISTKTNEMQQSKWGIVGEVSLEREVKVRSWRPRQVSGLYSKSDTTSLEFYEKESDTIQLIYPLAKITLAAVWWLDCGARLEARRPVTILHMSNLEVMVAIEVVRRVNFWYITRQRQ